jgi:hypothetical protein
MILLLASITHGYNYCLIGKGIFYSTECFDSYLDDLANVCFECIIQNSSGSYTKCGSMLEYGAADCNNATVTATVKALCGGTGFVCNFNNGNNQSQFNIASQPTLAPTHPISPPTNNVVYSTYSTPLNWLFSFVIGLIMYPL